MSAYVMPVLPGIIETKACRCKFDELKEVAGSSGTITYNQAFVFRRLWLRAAFAQNVQVKFIVQGHSRTTACMDVCTVNVVSVKTQNHIPIRVSIQAELLSPRP